MRVHAKYLMAMAILAAAAFALDDQHQAAEVVQVGVPLNSSPVLNASVATRTSSRSADELVMPTDSSWKSWPSVTDF
jgi:hypothetical protein